VIRGRVHVYLRGGEHDCLLSLGVSDDGVSLLSVMLIAGTFGGALYGHHGFSGFDLQGLFQ
jgi:hypothetical protein